MNSFFKQFDKYSDTVSYNLLEAEYDNFSRLSNYAKMVTISQILYDKHQSFYDSSELVDLKDNILRMKQLKKQPPLKVTKKGDCTFSITKSKRSSFYMLPVKAENDSTANFIFDTGAGENVVSYSTAKKLNFEILSNLTAKVAGATAVENNSTFAIAKKITIGNIEVDNAIFMVFADSLMGTMKGIIGFSIYNRFEEVIFTDSTIIIPKIASEKTIEPNLFFYETVCVISARFNNRNLSFLFDTGMSDTYFYQNFYDNDTTYFNQFETSSFAMKGIGGYKILKAKIVPKLELKIANQSFSLEDKYIQLEYDESHPKLNGNIGRDIFSQVQKATINFKNSYVDFE